MEKELIKVAILVDGGFYRKVAAHNWGIKSGEERAKELKAYCMAHAKDKTLYRVFYYDCPPLDKQVYHPLLKKNINLSKSDTYQWTTSFLETMKSFRKFALRLGSLSEFSAKYTLDYATVKKLCGGSMRMEDLSEGDFVFCAEQKGVDMRIGLDIASLAYKKQVNQIVLISGGQRFRSCG